MGLQPGAIVLAHLVHPAEKLWGLLLDLGPTGLTMRGFNLGSFDEWVAEQVRHEAGTLGPVTTFVPMHRVERLFLDEQVGEVESYCQLFERRVGRPVRDFLGPPPG